MRKSYRLWNRTADACVTSDFPVSTTFAMLARRALSRIPKPLGARLNSTTAPPAKANVQEARLASSHPPQAPNYVATWSTSQAPRPKPASSPRFEQIVMETQPAPLSAMQLIAEEPIRLVQGRKAVCDGGA